MSSIHNRKRGHVEACLNEDVSYSKQTGFEHYDFIHSALPELDFDKISTEAEFLGKKISMPLIISGMTGGGSLSKKINHALAVAAQEENVAMGVGSQRIAFEMPHMQESFRLRHLAPDIPLLANLGAVQLNYGFGIKEARAAVDSIGADALVFHLNPMQEVIQGGHTDFSSLARKIAGIAKQLHKPVIVKEVGFGISSDAGKKLSDAGVYAVDISGAGGTSWSAVESYLASAKNRDLGKLFWNWGIPTVKAILANRNRKFKLIAGGGVRSGLDIAKAIALGADYATIAGPFLKAAMQGPNDVVELIRRIKLELKCAMFGIGAKNLSQLKKTKAIVKAKGFYQ